jgi:phage shock protein C
MAAEKRLYRSTKNRMLGGICGGLGEYLGLDPTVVRLIVVLISLFVFLVPSLIAYLILWLVIPEEPAEQPPTTSE